MRKQSHRGRPTWYRANRATPTGPVPTMHVIEAARFFKMTIEIPSDPDVTYEGS